MSTPIEFFERHGYLRDREARLREIAGDNPQSLSLEAANQIKHLKECLRELVSITEIHSKATGNSFAWAELEEAKKALSS